MKVEFNDINSRIQENVTQLSQLNLEIFTLKNQTSNQVLNQIESKKKEKAGELQNKEYEKNEFQKINRVINSIEISEINNKIERLLREYSGLDDFTKQIENYSKHKKNIDDLNGFLSLINKLCNLYNINIKLPLYDSQNTEKQFSSIKTIIESKDRKSVV